MILLTYLTMKGSLANPLYHSSVAASRVTVAGQKIEVINVWGFYASPMVEPKTLCSKTVKAIKDKLGIKFDFNGDYGFLKQEDMRFLDLGRDLMGITFHVTEAQYQHLVESCNARMAREKAAIDEATAALRAEGIEPDSAKILLKEMQLAEAAKREPRLRPFSLKVGLTGCVPHPTMQESSSCKTNAVDLLREAGIDEEFLADITRLNVAIPRFVGKIKPQPVILHSTGVLHRHESKRTGTITIFREWRDAKLFWTVPPQRILGDQAELESKLTIDSTRLPKVQALATLLEQVEHDILNDAKLPAEYHPQRDQVVTQLFRLYDAFSTINSTTLPGDTDNRIRAAENYLKELYNDLYEKNDHLASHLSKTVKTSIFKLLQDRYEPTYCP